MGDGIVVALPVSVGANCELAVFVIFPTTWSLSDGVVVPSPMLPFEPMRTSWFVPTVSPPVENELVAVTDVTVRIEVDAVFVTAR